MSFMCQHYIKDLDQIAKITSTCKLLRATASQPLAPSGGPREVSGAHECQWLALAFPLLTEK